MICRKCGTDLPDKTIRCSNCGIKVNIVCPECKTITPFGEKYCINCGFELIKICPSCNSANIYSAVECRKCKKSLTHIKAITDKDVSIHKNIQESTTESSEFLSEVVEPISTSVILQEENSPVFSHQNDVSEESAENPSDYNDEPIIKSAEEHTINPEEQNINLQSELQEEEKEEVVITQQTEYEQEQETSEEIENKQEVEPQETIEQEPQEEKEEVEEEQKVPQYIIQEKAVSKIVQTIKKSINKHIIAVNGPEGCGKTAVLNQSRDILAGEGYLCLQGSCTPLSQITSFGYFQDAFLRMLGLPPYINSTESFLRDFKKSELNHVFNFLQPQELSLFLNFLYPSQKDSFENILENRQLMFSIMEKVIKNFLLNSNIIMIIDNFDLLDGASFDFITYIASKNFFNNRLKLLVAYQQVKPVQNYFDMVIKDDNIFTTINLNKLSPKDIIDTIKRSLGLNLPDILPADYLAEIIRRSEGNAIGVEQYIAYLFDINYITINDNELFLNIANKPENEPENFEELIKLRLNTLPVEIKNVLFMSSIMGYRFATNIICNAIPMQGKKVLNILGMLRQELFIVPVDDFTCEFKNLTIWKYIYKEAKADPLYKDNTERLYSILKSRVLSSNIQKLISYSEALSKEEEFLIWQHTADITAKLGDTNIYVIAQKQCLKILEEQEMPNAENVREIIYEQIGKLLSQKSPSEAIGYLANVLDSRIKSNDINKIIDISGYFVSSCYLTGNYFGVKEAVDTVISHLNKNGTKISNADLAMIKTRKLNALLNIGNSEEVISIIRDEILIEINKEMTVKHTDISYKNILTDAWFLSNIALAKAYLMQGRQDIFAVTSSIREFMQDNKIQSEYYSTQLDIIEAFAYSTRGEIALSNDIITSVADNYTAGEMDKKTLCELNIINIINKIFSNQMYGIKNELFELATFANNINEHFIKNIIKLLLGYIIKEEGDEVKALTIYNEQVTYFAKEKIALGALLSWAFITKMNLDLGDIDTALNTATKALEIAESPKIRNLFFIIYFQKYIAQAYRIKGDFASVKMYLEKALLIARQNNLKYQLVFLYMEYGRYMEQYMNVKKSYEPEYLKLTSDMYNKAISIANELKLDSLIEKATRERSNFRRYCQANSIEI